MKKILVVEDDPSIAEVIKIILEENGYEVFLDSTGHEVLRNKIPHDINLALVDYLLPGTNGAQVIEKIHQMKEFQTIPVILMSANTEAELVEFAQKCSATDYLPKPFDIDLLIEKVNSLLNL